MNLLEIILLFFSFQALLLGIFFFIRKTGNQYADKIFAVFLWLFSYGIFTIVLFWTRFNDMLFIQLLYTFYVAFSLFGCTFYFYIRNLLTGKKITKADFYHFIPLMITILLNAGYFVLPYERKLHAFENDQLNEYSYWVSFHDYTLTLLLVIYSIIVYRNLVIKCKKDSNLRSWVRLISRAFLLFAFSFVAYDLIIYLGLMTRELEYLITLVMVGFVGIVSYFSVLQPEVFNGKSFRNALSFKKYQSSGLSHEFAKELKLQVEQLMREEKPYLKSGFKLDDLSEMLGVSRHHASQIINEQFNLSFYDFINTYRIEEAKIRLRSDKTGSIDKVAYECGFNNRVSFYKSFKKVEDLTPSEFRSIYRSS